MWLICIWPNSTEHWFRLIKNKVHLHLTVQHYSVWKQPKCVSKAKSVPSLREQRYTTVALGGTSSADGGRFRQTAWVRSSGQNASFALHFPVTPSLWKLAAIIKDNAWRRCHIFSFNCLYVAREYSFSYVSICKTYLTSLMSVLVAVPAIMCVCFPPV